MEPTGDRSSTDRGAAPEESVPAGTPQARVQRDSEREAFIAGLTDAGIRPAKGGQMNPFEKLLRADGTALVKALYRFRVDTRRDPELRREEVAQNLGLNATQLVCGFGFNKHAGSLTDILFVLGFASYGELVARRNFLFINDIYKQLSINNILEIYTSVEEGDALVDSLPDLIYSRLTRIEAEIEGTINPIMIGSYKLEIRAIYEHRLAPLEMAEMRLGSAYSGLRALTNEAALFFLLNSFLSIQCPFCLQIECIRFFNIICILL